VQLAGKAELSSWQGTSRYEVVRFIGRGGMGAVYEAHDRERNRRVAVKTVLRFDPGALYLLKQEFRTLANLLHPNLVRLYDLVATESDGVFFTMELVSGRHFCDYVWRPEARPPTIDPGPTVAGPGARAAHDESGTVSVDRRPRPGTDGRRTTPADIDRLRGALRQLVEGVHAAHAAGKVHRDIKPSNVIVDDDGRVVLLDFGVAAELSRAADRHRSESHVVGTPLYMAPEQALDETPTPASDWYSVGAILYEALVGKPPFAGDATDALYRKAILDAPAPCDLVDGVPSDLNALCCELLRREPGERPNGRRVLRRLGVETRLLSPTPIAGFAPKTTLVGRGAELRALHLAYVKMRTGGAVLARVRGPSGIGKSALVESFLDGLATRTDTVVLRGCAYERESIAYKAIDGALDALSQCLVALHRRGETVSLPDDAWALAHLFPVLRRAPAIPAERAGGSDDPMTLRRRAIGALRAILSQLARLGPIVLHLDDVQWGDVDSATLLLEVIRPPAPPPVLVILGYRDSAESEAGPFLRYLNDRAEGGFDQRDIPVHPLTLEEARNLALNVLGADDEAAQRVADAIAHGSGGNAFFVEDLARSAKAQGPAADAAFVAPAGSTIEDMIRRRIARLDAGAQSLLELAAVHGQPIPTSILGVAAGAGERLDSQLGELREGHFVRIEMREGREAVGAAHDRIREAIVANLAPEALRSRHRQLAVAYELEHDVDAEAIVGHWVEAGESERAAKHAERAAERAWEKLAFDRATQLYRLTLGSLPAGSPEAVRVRLRLAEALSLAGRGAEAARLYLDEARGAPEPQRMALERAAASQLLFSGQIDEGTRLLRRILAGNGRGAPSSRWTALGWFVFYLVWLRIRGLRVEPREPEELPPRVREQMEAIYIAAAGLAVVDVLIGASLVVRFLTVALRTRHRGAIVAGGLLRAGQLATIGGEESEQERVLLELVQRLSERAGAAAASEQSMRATHALRAFLRGRWREAFDLCESAFALPASRDVWNMHALAVYGDFALVYLGEHPELANRLPGQLSDAEQRGDVMKIVNLSVGVAPFVFLARDEPRNARRSIAGAFARWPQAGFLIPHWRALIAQVDIDLYEGLSASAHARMAREARAIQRSFFTLGQYMRAVTQFARARSAIAASFEAPESKKSLLRGARRLVRSLESEGMPWTSVFASMAHASLANAEADREAAVHHLRAAVERADAAGMTLHAASARFRLSTLLGAAEGSEARKSAEEAMRAKEVRSPERFAGMLLPGRWSRTMKW
jgi:eukaryotic-like serine/threonine-protein kinase